MEPNTIALVIVVAGWALSFGRHLQVLERVSRLVETIEKEQHLQDKRILALEISRGKRK